MSTNVSTTPVNPTTPVPTAPASRSVPQPPKPAKTSAPSVPFAVRPAIPVNQAAMRVYIAVVRNLTDEVVDGLARNYVSRRLNHGSEALSEQEFNLLRSQAIQDRRKGLVLFLYWRNTYANDRERAALALAAKQRLEVPKQKDEVIRHGSRLVGNSASSPKPAVRPTEAGRPKAKTVNNGWTNPKGGEVTSGFVTLAEVLPKRAPKTSAKTENNGGNSRGNNRRNRGGNTQAA